jgi:hypothetical protein
LDDIAPRMLCLPPDTPPRTCINCRPMADGSICRTNTHRSEHIKHLMGARHAQQSRPAQPHPPSLHPAQTVLQTQCMSLCISTATHQSWCQPTVAAWLHVTQHTTGINVTDIYPRQHVRPCRWVSHGSNRNCLSYNEQTHQPRPCQATCQKDQHNTLAPCVLQVLYTTQPAYGRCPRA